jgi:hypothetical protein
MIITLKTPYRLAIHFNDTFYTCISCGKYKIYNDTHIYSARKFCAYQKTWEVKTHLILQLVLEYKQMYGHNNSTK